MFTGVLDNSRRPKSAPGRGRADPRVSVTTTHTTQSPGRKTAFVWFYSSRLLDNPRSHLWGHLGSQ
jgi:hypothetical protein